MAVGGSKRPSKQQGAEAVGNMMEHSGMDPGAEFPGVVAPEADSDSDYEEPTMARGKGRARGGRGRGRARGRGGATGRGRAAQPADVGPDGTLFDVVRVGRASLTAVVDEWIESYKNDRDSALLDLIQFFIHSSGCKGKITPHMYASLEHAEIIKKMTEEFDEDSGDYPLIQSGPTWKKFRSNFCEFIMLLVRQCQYSIIYDQYMMDNIISLLTGLTDSQVRAFRHTSTLASMKLMTALVDVALTLSIAVDHTQRQYEAERQKEQRKKSNEKLDLLLAKRQEIEENQEEIRNMLTYIFKGVFVHRYRDTQPEIRSICMQEIGLWMRRYPTMFLDDKYLKYVGWTMYDRVGDVRLGCLKCLEPLYSTDELSPKLELFTNRFKERIVEMTLDKEYDVAVQAVKLVISILKYSDNVLTDKDAENVYELVYSSHRAVAQAAGEFLNTKLFGPRPDEAGKPNKSSNTPQMRDLVQFFIESELHEHGAYLVDSLWEISPMLKDWECMTDLLLAEPGREEDAMDDRQESSLIEIMVCCVKQAATGEYPVGRGPTRKLTAKEHKSVLDDKIKLTDHFIVALPQLLAKYNADAEKVANLLNIPMHFELENYTKSRQEKALESLLRHIQDIVEKHTSSEVLENCSKVLENFCNEEYTIARKCNVARSTLIDRLVEKYKDAYQAFFQEGEEPDEDDAYALMASLKRIYAFYQCHDLNSWNLWETLFYITRQGMDAHGIPEEITCKALSCCQAAIMWYLEMIDESTPEKTQMKDLKKKLNALMQVCSHLMVGNQPRTQEEAYVTICDTLIMFSKHLADSAPPMKPLVYEPDRSLQAALGAFLQDKVFIDEEDDEMDENQKIEELHKRRNFLASFCKLIVYNVVPIRQAADMFKFYMKYYNDYGDIIKAALGKSREINKVQTAKTLAASLIQSFKEIQQEQNFVVDRGSEAFMAIKELARRFSLSFGLDQLKNRDAVAAMHKEGILFALHPEQDQTQQVGPPPNLSFLEVISEFSGKLMKGDKKTVVQYLDRHLPGGVPHGRGEEFAPYLTYRNSLVQGDLDMSAHMPPSRLQASHRSRGRPRKRAAQEDTDNMWLGKTPSRRIPGPMTSTAIKRSRHDDMSSDGAGSEYEGNKSRSSSKPKTPKGKRSKTPTRKTKKSDELQSLKDAIENFNIEQFESPLRTSSRIDSPARASTGARQRGSLDWSAAPRHKRSRESLRDMRASHLVLPTYEEGDEDDDEESVQIQDASDPEQEDEEDTLQADMNAFHELDESGNAGGDADLP